MRCVLCRNAGRETKSRKAEMVELEGLKEFAGTNVWRGRVPCGRLCIDSLIKNGGTGKTAESLTPQDEETLRRRVIN